VQRWLDQLGVGVVDIREHVARLQELLLRQLAGALPPPAADPRGSFLSFSVPDAGVVHHRLHAAGVITDHRGAQLRVGLGLYHDEADVERLAAALAAAARG
jgi:kynureninase